MQSALTPAGIQATRILDLWHLTLAVCCVVFAAILLACLIPLVRAPRANRATPADVSTVNRPQPRMRLWVNAATGLSALLLFGLILADVLTDRALSRLPVDKALHIEVTGY
ncbi:cytochrome C oxidase subunit II, partial [Caballeronia sp. LZ035]|nr:cytochrome C oxidase subunit II [Caballeronia sp. LZ035]